MTTPTCWIGVAARAHVMAGKEEGFVMFAHGKHSAVKQVQPGDWFAYYAPTRSMGDKDTIRRFVAIGTIDAGEPVAMQMSADMTDWRRAATYFDGQEADIYLLLPQFDFVTDPAHWGMYFRKSLFKISITDFSHIADAMGAGQKFNLGDS